MNRSESGKRRKKKRREMMMEMKGKGKGREEEEEEAEEELEIRKGPWKAEEDEVLLNHVKKHGPRDWSSIRSKGLLLRTGKSCRLRWVNKLRPNLKNGCKFTAEEERVVIELQAELGNKWARIATHLPGRTDNDVKNFWSSRRKRLARLSQTSATAASAAATTSSSSSSPPRLPLIPSSSIPTDTTIPRAKSSRRTAITTPTTSSNTGNVAPAPNHLPPLQVTAMSSSLEAESSLARRPCPSSLVGTPEPMPMFPPLTNDIVKMEVPGYDDSLLFVPYPQVPPPPPPPQPELTFAADSHDLLPRMEDPYFYGMFAPVVPELGDVAQLPLPEPLLDPTVSCTNASRGPKSTATPDAFFDDFPEDMFDPIEPLPSPSEW